MWTVFTHKSGVWFSRVPLLSTSLLIEWSGLFHQSTGWRNEVFYDPVDCKARRVSSSYELSQKRNLIPVIFLTRVWWAPGTTSQLFASGLPFDLAPVPGTNCAWTRAPSWSCHLLCQGQAPASSQFSSWCTRHVIPRASQGFPGLCWHALLRLVSDRRDLDGCSLSASYLAHCPIQSFSLGSSAVWIFDGLHP